MVTNLSVVGASSGADALTFRTKVVLVRDRVRTKTERCGVVRAVTGHSVAHVVWDDGEEFPIKFCHLEVLAHGHELPKWFTDRSRNAFHSA